MHDLHLALSSLAFAGSTNHKKTRPIDPILTRKMKAILVLPSAASMIAEATKGPTNPDVRPTVLKRAKKRYALGVGTTSARKAI